MNIVQSCVEMPMGIMLFVGSVSMLNSFVKDDQQE